MQIDPHLLPFGLGSRLKKAVPGMNGGHSEGSTGDSGGYFSSITRVENESDVEWVDSGGRGGSAIITGEGGGGRGGFRATAGGCSTVMFKLPLYTPIGQGLRH